MSQATNKNVYIYCDGGFGNRFNSLVSGLSLAKVLDREPVILWPENNWCRASFLSLFDVNLHVSDQSIQQLLAQNHTVNILHDNQFGAGIEWQSPESIDISQLRNTGCHLLYYSSLIPSWVNPQDLRKEIVPALRFKAELYEGANRQIELHLPSTSTFFGVHLRKTDFGNSNQADVSALATIRSRPNDWFFVCSDDADTETRFSTEPNVFVHKKRSYVEKLVPGDWNNWITDSNNQPWPFNVDRSSDSVKQALVDLLILSKSQLVPTNLHSTFLKTAYLLQEAHNSR